MMFNCKKLTIIILIFFLTSCNQSYDYFCYESTTNNESSNISSSSSLIIDDKSIIESNLENLISSISTTSSSFNSYNENDLICSYTEKYSYIYFDYPYCYEESIKEYGTITLSSGGCFDGIFPIDGNYEILCGDYINFKTKGIMYIQESMPGNRTGEYEIIETNISLSKRVNFKIEKDENSGELIIVNIDDNIDYFSCFASSNNKVSSIEYFVYDIYEEKDGKRIYSKTHKLAKSKYMYEGLELYGTVNENYNSINMFYAKNFDTKVLADE